MSSEGAAMATASGARSPAALIAAVASGQRPWAWFVLGVSKNVGARRRQSRVQMNATGASPWRERKEPFPSGFRSQRGGWYTRSPNRVIVDYPMAHASILIPSPSFAIIGSRLGRSTTVFSPFLPRPPTPVRQAVRGVLCTSDRLFGGFVGWVWVRQG